MRQAGGLYVKCRGRGSEPRPLPPGDPLKPQRKRGTLIFVASPRPSPY